MTMDLTYIKLLQHLTSDDFLLVGGKGANLGRMLEAQLPVPPGFVILTNAYQEFIKLNNLQPTINNLIKQIDSKNPEEIEAISAHIHQNFEQGKIPPPILTEIATIYTQLGSPPVALRSSATAEDLPGMSFAGQYTTYLNLKGTSAITQHLKKCWASLWNSRAIAYRIKQNLSPENLAHGVIVQTLINSEKSGILFTANPVNGRRDQMLINSSWGLGEAIVSGKVNPDQWILAKQTGQIIETQIASKTVMTVNRENGIQNVSVPTAQITATSLTETELRQLWELALKVENYFHSPQDLEWAYQQGQFYLVQTRPITSLYPLPQNLLDSNNLRIYLNMNLYSQAMKEPFTPMGEAIIRTMIQGLIQQYGNQKNPNPLWWYHNLNGRLYIDLTSILANQNILNKLKHNPNDKDPLTTKTLLQVVERNKHQLTNQFSLLNFWHKLNPRLLKLLLNSGIKVLYGKFCPVKARNQSLNLEKTFIEHLQNQRATLSTIEEKLEFIETQAPQLMVIGFGIVFYVSICSTYISQVKSIMEEHLGDSLGLNDVEKSIPYNVTTEMGMELLEIAKTLDQRGETATKETPEVQTFLNKYGHRASIELDVGISPWKEQPQYVLDLINTYIDNQQYNQVIDKFTQGKQQAQEAIYIIKQRLEQKGQTRKARQVERLLLDFREMFGIRELPKSFTRKFLTMFREILLEIGQELMLQGRIKQPEDIFWVTLDDLQQHQDLRELIKVNREQYQREFNRNLPRIITSTGETIYAPIEEENVNILKGVAVSAGIYEGRVRILHSPEEGDKINPGEILVTTGTNPAWTPLFLKLGALIMETGGSISHGSVIAREYGLPAVAGVSEATTKLQDGQLVRVNGETGQVYLLTGMSGKSLVSVYRANAY